MFPGVSTCSAFLSQKVGRSITKSLPYIRNTGALAMRGSILEPPPTLQRYGYYY